MNVASKALAALGLVTGIIVLALGIVLLILALGIVILALLFASIVVPASQDGPLIWGQLAICFLCLAFPGAVLLLASIDYLRNGNVVRTLEEDSQDGQPANPAGN